MNTIVLEQKKGSIWVKDVCLTIGASLLIALFAYIAIPLPFTPVPLSTQGTLILLLSALLGSKRAPAAVALFLTQGALGLPVFAFGGAGIERFLGPRGGYLIGYLIASYVVAKIIEKAKEKTLLNAFFAMAIGNGVLLFMGAAWLSYFVGGIKQAILLGVVPFVLGDLLKLGVSLKLLHWMGRGNRKPCQCK